MSDGLDGWRAVEQGAIPTWRTIVGADDPSWLAPPGRNLVETIAADLASIIGDDWIAEIFAPPRSPVSATVARSLCPTFQLRGRAAGLADLVWFWLSLRCTRNVPGQPDVIRQLKSDQTGVRFRHAMAQMRLANLAQLDGHSEVTFELNRNLLKWQPVDVAFTVGGHTLGLEVYTVSEDDTSKYYDTAYHVNCAHLDNLARRFGIHWSGEVPATDNEPELRRWRAATSQAASQARDSGRPIQLRAADGKALVAAPGPAADGTWLTGPALIVDVGKRLTNLLRKKAFQASRAGSGVLWVEDHGASQFLFPLQRASAAEKLAAWSALLQPILEVTPDLDAIVYIRRGRTDSATTPEVLRWNAGKSSLIINSPYPGLSQETTILARCNDAVNNAVRHVITEQPCLWQVALTEATGMDRWNFANLVAW